MMAPLRACPGCGAELQCLNPEQMGYAPPGQYGKEGALCQRCFRLSHYGELTRTQLQDEQVWEMIAEEAARCRGQVVFLDALNLESGSRILERALSLGLPMLCVLTKADLLDRWIGRRDLVANFRSRWPVVSGDVPVMAMNLRDRKEVRGLEEILVRRFGASSRLLLIGGTNAGKTTFLRGLTAAKEPTVSALPGATQGRIVAVSRRGITVVDSPGLRLGDPFLPHFCPDCLHALTASTKITRRVFVLRPGQSLMWGGMGWLRVDGCGDRDWVKIIGFAPREVTLHRTRTGRETELVSSQAGAILSPPCKSCLPTLEKLGLQERSVILEKGMDLSLANLGWLSVYQGTFEGTFQTLKGLEVLSRPWLIPPTPRRLPLRRSAHTGMARRNGH